MTGNQSKDSGGIQLSNVQLNLDIQKVKDVEQQAAAEAAANKAKSLQKVTIDRGKLNG